MKKRCRDISKECMVIWTIIYAIIVAIWVLMDWNYFDVFDYGNIKWYPATVMSFSAEIIAVIMTIVWVGLCSKFFKQDRMEFLKPVCVALLVFSPLFHMCVGRFFSSSSLLDRTWMYVVEVMMGAIVVVLSIYYLTKSRKQGRKKIFMIICLILGIIWTLLSMVEA